MSIQYNKSYHCYFSIVDASPDADAAKTRLLKDATEEILAAIADDGFELDGEISCNLMPRTSSQTIHYLVKATAINPRLKHLRAFL